MNLSERLNKSGIPSYFAGANWQTPATRYPLGKVGTAELTRTHYQRGVYVMEGVGGYAVFVVGRPIPVTCLSIYGNEWMIDDPLHWLGMKAFGEAASGNVLVIGLGLGLVTHALLANKAVESVAVYEASDDVIELMSPLIPHDPRLEIWKQEFWSLKDLTGHGTLPQPDIIVLDIWTSSEHSPLAVSAGMTAALMDLKRLGHKGKTFIWGTRDPELNPSIKPMGEDGERYLTTLKEAMR